MLFNVNLSLASCMIQNCRDRVNVKGLPERRSSPAIDCMRENALVDEGSDPSGIRTHFRAFRGIARFVRKPAVITALTALMES